MALFMIGLTACNLNAPVPPNQEPGLSEDTPTLPPTTPPSMETPTRESTLQIPTTASSPTLPPATCYVLYLIINEMVAENLRYY